MMRGKPMNLTTERDALDTEEMRKIAVAREAQLRPIAEKIIAQYTRGLITTDELAFKLLEIGLEV
jgi:hypothetical protein